jgi:hypothetical protein
MNPDGCPPLQKWCQEDGTCGNDEPTCAGTVLGQKNWAGFVFK